MINLSKKHSLTTQPKPPFNFEGTILKFYANRRKISSEQLNKVLKYLENPLE